MRKRRRRSAARSNTGVLCHECHTVLPTQRAGARQRRIPTHHFVLSTSFSCQLKIGLSLSFSYDRPPLHLQIALSAVNCSWIGPPIIVTGQICEAISGEFSAESGKISTSIESGKISTSISTQKPSTPATAPSESVLWTVVRNHATAACSTVTDKEEEEGTDNEGPRRNCQTPHLTKKQICRDFQHVWPVSFPRSKKRIDFENWKKLGPRFQPLPL